MCKLANIFRAVAIVTCLAIPELRAEPHETGNAAESARSLSIGGLRLSLPLDDFRRFHSDAVLKKLAATGYCRGEAVEINELNRFDAVWRQGESTTWIKFGYARFRHGITTVMHEEAIAFEASEFAPFRREAVRRYGPFTRIRYPLKMNPSGLIVGLEWEIEGVAFFSIAIHRDYANGSDAIKKTTFLTGSLPGMRRHALAAAHYRRTVAKFRASCSETISSHM